jgi:threonine aldolase
MVDRLAEDHQHACLLAEGLSKSSNFVLDPGMVRTNLVFFELADHVALSPDAVISKLREETEILIGGHGERGFRAVSHYWVGEQEVGQLLDALVRIVDG